MEYAVNEKVRSPRLSNTKICGHQKELTERFFYERLFSQNARETIWKEAYEAFALRVDDEGYEVGGVWQGEFWGKQMLSACDAYRYSLNKEELSCIVEEADKLIATQDENGYIGTYKESANVFMPPEDYNGPRWNWNVWGRKYTLWGLVEAYEVSGESRILDAASRMCDQLINELYDNGYAIVETGAFGGLPSCSILKPMLLLYKHTGDKKIIDFCKNEILDKWEREDGKCPNLIANALSRKPVASWYPEPHVWAKAYEMMSCYEGIIEYYKITGDKKYFDAVKNFFDLIVKHEENVLGSVAFIDMFGNAKYSANAVSEPCDSIHYMRLCHELYILTGDAFYMDKYEKCFFNAFFAGVFKDGKWASRAVRGAGRHMWTKQARMIYQHCCVNNMARTLATYGENAVVETEKGIVVNLFAPYKVDTDDYSLEISDGYFSGAPIEINVHFKNKAKDILIRKPSWCEELGISESCAICGDYAVVVATENEISFTVSFGMKAVVHPFGFEANDLCRTDWHYFRWMTPYAPACCVPSSLYLDKEPRCTVTYGPLLLARSKNTGLTEKEIFDTSPISADTIITLKPIKAQGAFAVFEAEYTVNGDTVRTTLCDFASAANEMPAEEKRFSIYF